MTSNEILHRRRRSWNRGGTQELLPASHSKSELATRCSPAPAPLPPASGSAAEGGARGRVLGLGGGSQNGRRGNDAIVRKRRRPGRAVAPGCRTPFLSSPLPSPPPSRPHPLGRSAPWRDSALRVPEKAPRSSPPAFRPRPLPSLSRVFSFSFEAGGVAAALPG